MKCVIVGAGAFNEASLPLAPGDFLIAADGGYSYVKRLGLSPDLSVGDFDSLGFTPDGDTLSFPPEKDDTDMALALREGEKRGYTEFLIFGGLGGRLDHTAANIQLLLGLALRGARGVLADGKTRLTVIRNSQLRLPARADGYVSVFAVGGPAHGVSIQGLKYPLDRASLSCDVPLGVSNEFVGQPALIEAEDGALLVMWEE